MGTENLPRNASAADFVIETLALSEAELRERVASLEADNRTYHELSVAAFDALRELTRQHRWRQEDLERERIENARLREEMLIRILV